MILATRGERVKLLKAGFSGQEIEALFINLNDITVTRDQKQKSPLEDKGSTPPPYPHRRGVRA